MKLLVTGRTSQLAQCLIEAAPVHPDIELVALGRPELDFEAPGSIGAVLADTRPDAVINAAAYTAVDQAEDEPERAFRVNARAPGELAAACRAAGARLIHVSTDYVFDGEAAGTYAPDAPTNPIGVYGQSKLAGEQAIAAAMDDYAIVRTAWVYSPFGRNFLKTMMQLPARSDVARVVADQRGNPTSAADLAEGLLAIADRWARGEAAGLGRVYHLAGTGETSWAGFAAHIFAACARLGLPSCRVEPIATAEWPTRARRPANSALDSSAFGRDFDFTMPDWRVSADRVIERVAGNA